MAKMIEKMNRKLQIKIFGAVCAIIAIIVLLAALGKVRSSAQAAYAQAVEEQERETYEMFYNSAFDMAEKKYHVSNDVKITVEGIKEEAKLEVLQVSDIEYIYHEDNTKIWTSVRGHGVYTVDLELSEFVIDNERKCVLVRVPRPKLNTAGLDYEYENYLFEDGIFNGSTKEGVSLAMEDLKTAQNQLRTKLSSTQTYYEMAENSAKELIERMVKNFNSELPELAVEVEFVD